MNTELVDLTNHAQREIYNVWNDKLTMYGGPDTQIQPSLYARALPLTGGDINLGIIERTAKAWGQIPLPISNIFKGSGQLTVADIPCLPVLDKEVTDFCKLKDISDDAILFYNTIRLTFYNMKYMSITLESDYELEDVKKIRFDVTLADSIENIFGMEDAFKKAIRGLISKDSRVYFVLTANIL